MSTPVISGVGQLKQVWSPVYGVWSTRPHESKSMTIQEMFDRAYLGLKAQGFERAINSDGGCFYQTLDGKRCAWGHVDHSVPANTPANMYGLRYFGVGLAAQLEHPEFMFAVSLQGTHDTSNTPKEVEEALLVLAKTYRLVVPGTGTTDKQV